MRFLGIAIGLAIVAAFAVNSADAAGKSKKTSPATYTKEQRDKIYPRALAACRNQFGIQAKARVDWKYLRITCYLG